LAGSGAGAATSGFGAGGVGSVTCGGVGTTGSTAFCTGSGTAGAAPTAEACAPAAGGRNASRRNSANASRTKNRPAVAHEADLGVGAIDRTALFRRWIDPAGPRAWTLHPSDRKPVGQIVWAVCRHTDTARRRNARRPRRRRAVRTGPKPPAKIVKAAPPGAALTGASRRSGAGVDAVARRAEGPDDGRRRVPWRQASGGMSHGHP